MTAIPHADAIGPGRADADLVRAAAAGDRRAFADIYNRYANRLHDFCIGMLRDRDDAADCVQDTFCTAATILGDLRDPDKLRPWLYSIARHQALKSLRNRRRERPSQELPDMASHDAGPNTLAARLELSNLVAEAAGGLSERDRSVLELAYRHGLDGPELATALGVSQTNANTMLYRLRDTVERSLGALLVSRKARTDPTRCPPLSAILEGWDGRFTMLMRKRIARHIESCPTCEDERRRLVNPTALLGATPVLIPAPGWLRDRTMSEVRLTSASSAMATQTLRHGDGASDALTARFASAAAPTDQMPAHAIDQSRGGGRRVALLVALLIGVPLTALGVVFALTRQPTTAVAPVDETATSAPPVETPRNVAPPVQPSTAKPSGRQGGSTPQQVGPRPSASPRASSTATATSPAPAPPPSAVAPTQEGTGEASSPVPQPNQTIFAPPPPPEPQPNQVPPPPPDEPAAEQELPPLITQGPLPDYFEDDPFVPPN